MKNRFEDAVCHYLTASQMHDVLACSMEKFNLIKGPPGSGKTILALSVCDRHLSPDVGYICTTVPLFKFIKNQKKCQCFLVSTESELQDLISGNHLKDLKALIVDDVHNLSCSKIAWLSLFNCVVSIHSLHLFLFGDHQMQNYKYHEQSQQVSDHMWGFCRSKGIEPFVHSLSHIHRNSRKIVSFLKSTASEDVDLQAITCSHNKSGDDVEIRCCTNLRSRAETNGIYQLVRDIICNKDREYQYEPEDIAILVDTADSSEYAAQLLEIMKHAPVDIIAHDAGRYPVEGIVIDTLDNYSGLDARLCIIITREPIGTFHLNSLDNPRYKAYCASRAIDRVVFVTDTGMDITKAEQMGLDNLPQVSIRSCAMKNYSSPPFQTKPVRWDLIVRFFMFQCRDCHTLIFNLKSLSYWCKYVLFKYHNGY